MQTRQGRIANEVCLVELRYPGHAGFIRVAQSVGIDADDDVLFFQTKYALRFHAEGTKVDRQHPRVRLVPKDGCQTRPGP